MGLLAHQGGWDEMLLVLVPIAVITALVQVVRKRAESQAAAQSSTRSIDAPSDPNFPTRSS